MIYLQQSLLCRIILPVRLARDYNMSMLSTTKMSSKGQIVIPEDIRNKMGFRAGDQFIVVAENDVVILKTIHQPSLKEIEGLVLEARKAAKKAGITKNSLKDVIKEARRK